MASNKAKETTFDEPFEQFGWWWLPEGEDDDRDMVPGTLHYAPNEGLRLDLLGGFPLPDPEPVNGIITRSIEDLVTRSSCDLIYGHTTDDEHWTLLDCRNHGSTSGSMPSTSNYRVGWGFAGAEELDDPAAFVASKWQFRLTDFEAWAGVRPIAVAHPDQDTVQLTYRHHDSEEWAAVDGMKLRAVATMSLRGDEIARTMSYRTALELESGTPLSVRETLHSIGAVRTLMSFLVGRDVHLEQLKAILDERNKITIRYHMGGATKRARQRRKYGPHDMFAWYGALGESFQVILDKWLTHAEDMRPVFNLASEAALGSELPLQIRFNALTQTLEGFHRRWKDADTKDVQFHDRLRELLAALPEAFCERLTGDTEALIRAVVDTRNHLTHRFRTPAPATVVDDHGVFALSEILAYWLRGQLLHWAGMPDDVLIAAAAADQRQRFLADCRDGWKTEKA